MHATTLRRVRQDAGFTLIELLIVMVVLGILASVSVPSYLTFEAKAEQAAAEANVSSALPAVEIYYESNDSYAGMSTVRLQRQSPGVSIGHAVVSADRRAYCLDATSGSKYAYYVGGDQNVGGDGRGFRADTGRNYRVGIGALCARVVSG